MAGGAGRRARPAGPGASHHAQQRRGTGQSARRSDLADVGELVHAAVRAGLEDVGPRAATSRSDCELCRRLCDLLPRHGREGHARNAEHDGTAQVDGQRDEDQDLPIAPRDVRLPGLYVWSIPFSPHRTGLFGPSTGQEEGSQVLRSFGERNGTPNDLARAGGSGKASEPQIAGLGELLPFRLGQQSLQPRGSLRGGKALSVVAKEVQEVKGENLTILLPGRAQAARSGATQPASSPPSCGR